MSMTEEQRRARYGGPLVTPRAARLLAVAVSVVFIAVLWWWACGSLISRSKGTWSRMSMLHRTGSQ